MFVGNLGAPDRFKFGLMGTHSLTHSLTYILTYSLTYLLGDSVNLASRLEELNKKYDTSILISGDVLSEMVLTHSPTYSLTHLPTHSLTNLLIFSGSSIILTPSGGRGAGERKKYWHCFIYSMW